VVTETPAVPDAVRAIVRACRILEGVAIASGELSLADFRVLAILSVGDARPSHLAARLALGRPTISATVDSLVRRGLVERSGVAEDSRATDLSLTPTGAATLGRIAQRMGRQLDLLCERTPDPAAVITSLAQLGEAIESSVIERFERAAREDAR
jgi:DNA-binding MarR family transcriptional regulator